MRVWGFLFLRGDEGGLHGSGPRRASGASPLFSTTFFQNQIETMLTILSQVDIPTAASPGHSNHGLLHPFCPLDGRAHRHLRATLGIGGRQQQLPNADQYTCGQRVPARVFGGE
jgi:hypothetical protein